MTPKRWTAQLSRLWWMENVFKAAWVKLEQSVILQTEAKGQSTCKDNVWVIWSWYLGEQDCRHQGKTHLYVYNRVYLYIHYIRTIRTNMNICLRDGLPIEHFNTHILFKTLRAASFLLEILLMWLQCKGTFAFVWFFCPIQAMRACHPKSNWRSYDVSFLGSEYDLKSARDTWQISTPVSHLWDLADRTMRSNFVCWGV